MSTTIHGSSRYSILELIRRGGVTTRRHLAEHTGFSRSVVAQVVAELIAEGLVVERALARSAGVVSRGRPTTVLHPAASAGWVAAFDFGHQHVGVAVAGLDSVIATEDRLEFDVDSDAPAALDAANTLLDAALVRLGARRSDLRAITIGIPYPVDKQTGIVRAPARLSSWASLAPAGYLGRGAACAVLIDNDANLGAWGEHLHGAGRGASSMLYIKIADGVGAGFIVDGVVLGGARGVGGEMGHVQVDPAGAVCRCGRFGCLEAVCSSAVVRRRIDPTGSSAAPFELTAATRPVFEDAGRSIGRVVAPLCTFLDPDIVVFGGSLGAVGEPLLAGIRASLAEFGEVSAMREVPLATAALGIRSELVGAVDRAVHAAWAADTRRRSTQPGGVLAG